MAAHVDPYWPWCVMYGSSRTTTLRVDQTDYGDGYTYRLTRGLNPARPSWSIAVPFVGKDELAAYDAFLTANASRGFWFTPPESDTDVFVTVDAWSNTVADKNQDQGIVGTLQATFVRSFNPQPVNPVLRGDA
jgi:phage-related protein